MIIIHIGILLLHLDKDSADFVHGNSFVVINQMDIFYQRCFLECMDTITYQMCQRYLPKTFKMKLQVLLFPLPSKLVQVTEVSPIERLLLDMGMQSMSGSVPELSAATGFLHETLA